MPDVYVQRTAQFAQPRQLGQSRPANTTAASLYSPADGVQTTVRTIVVCNTSSAAADYRIFHDDDGTTYDETTALFWDITLPANTTESIELNIEMADPDGNLAIRTDTANALTFTAYGDERQVRAR